MEDLAVFTALSKISAQPHTKLCIQFLTRENNDKNNTFPSGKQSFTIVWGCAETLPIPKSCGFFRKEFREVKKKKIIFYWLRVSPYSEKL